MKQLVRFHAAGAVRFGRLVGDEIAELDGDILDDPADTGRTFARTDVRLLLPMDPQRVSKVVGVANNYSDPHNPRPVTPHPRWFTKLPSALGLHDDVIDIPRHASDLNYEGELAVIIGRGGRCISIDDAADHVFGVTIGNDWSENTWYLERRDRHEPSRLVSKSVDGWAVLYPIIFQGLDWSDLAIDIRLNGDVVAFGRTSQMHNSVAYLIHYLSHFVTLAVGDVIFSGTVAPPVQPGHRRNMFDGDVVEVEIEGMGVLRNTVRMMSLAGVSYVAPGEAKERAG